eukprot:CAMPEP_0181382710 /NCGR_PEP_ID=MMETSP1106-20121128/20907_1 /TAXON_ID=81844 /ORGANISM="Mantoniella antarctica, Strain SL-175" /LENGTH=261 /DNA_ID=CAMNT_0023502193 /DNA_START=54 /DNA_END=836 /DNA_ORIENTATION=+
MKLPVPDAFGVLAPSSALLHAWGAPASLLARVDPRRLRLAHPLVPWAVCAAAGIRATRDAVTEQRFLTEAEEMGQGTDAVDTLGSGRSNLSFDTSGGDGGGGDFSLDTDRHLSATHPSGNESLDSERHLSASPLISGGISGGEVGDLHELTAAATVFTSSNEPAMPLPVLEAAVAAAPAADDDPDWLSSADLESAVQSEAALGTAGTTIPVLEAAVAAAPAADDDPDWLSSADLESAVQSEAALGTAGTTIPVLEAAVAAA